MLDTKQDNRLDPGDHRVQSVLEALDSATVGKRAISEMLVCALIAGGHVLIEDIPGTGKTLLAKAVAAATGLQYSRVQCTADLLPSDIVGASIFHPQTSEFHFRPGPVFANLVLVDELNRASPRSQSALLEAMEERQVTVDGQTYALEEPFIVLATENPLDADDAFPLPSSQLDRFLFRLSIGYPNPEDEIEILRQAPAIPEPAIDRAGLLALQAETRRIHVSDRLLRYLAGVLRGTRDDPSVALGASPRAGALWMQAARAKALMAGRSYVIPDDIRDLAIPVLGHRLRAKSHYAAEVEAIIDDVLGSVPVPRGESQ